MNWNFHFKFLNSWIPKNLQYPCLVCFRWIVFRRVFIILGLLYLMRSITMFVTVLPVASTTYYCSPRSNHTTLNIVFLRVWQLASGFGMSINGKHTFCGDYIYSGHTMIFTMGYLIVKECKYWSYEEKNTMSLLVFVACKCYVF